MKIDPLGAPETMPAPAGAQEAKAQAYLITQPTGQTFWSIELNVVYAGQADGEEDARAKTAEAIARLRAALGQLESPVS